jgi:excisionase family DNA binding protein
VKLAVPVGEAADLIGCSESMLWKLIAQGDIAKAKVGRRTVIRVAELERFLAESEQANASARHLNEECGV